jgi:hypothetical protein
MNQTAKRVVHVSEGATIAALIDNVYGELTSSQARDFIMAIDIASNEDRSEREAAETFLATVGIVVVVGGVSR